MTCRREMDDIKTEGWAFLRDRSGRKPAYCPDGVRHGGGTGLVRSLVCNVGTCHSDGTAVDLGEKSIGHNKEDTRQQKLRGVEYLMQSTGADRLVVAMQPRNSGGAKGTDHPGSLAGQSHVCGRN